MRMSLLAVAGVALLPLTLASCGGPATTAGGKATGTITYWLWDSNQQPAYQQCADDFHRANPDITVKITQLGWDDYWSKLTTGLVSGTAPDVFANHLAKYPELVTRHAILPLDDVVRRDKVDVGIYEPGLADLWVGQDGRRYGLPKDWDTVALFYNKQLTDKAGITAEQLRSLTWNPTDGGTYERAIAHLTVDSNGRRGDERGFDRSRVKTYGLWLENSGNGMGQTQWSMYAASNGWTFTDKNPWGSRYNYDDPKFQQAIAWWKGLIDKGYMPPLKASTGVSWNDMLTAGKAATATNGSWMIGSVFAAASATFTPAVAPLPTGPVGTRMSMLNGLADAIYAGTRNREASWQWVKYLASPGCEDVVGRHAVVFPAIPAATDLAQERFAARGVDVTAFTVNVKDRTTVLFPITDHASEIDSIMKAAMDAVISGEQPVSSLSVVNERVNALFR